MRLNQSSTYWISWEIGVIESQSDKLERWFRIPVGISFVGEIVKRQALLSSTTNRVL